MKISAVKLYENGFMAQPFAMGGEGTDGLDPSVKYRSSLQNYVIDTGSEVILVDTGMPAEAPEQVPDEKTPIYMGRKIRNYVDALADAGYRPEQVSRILITHKHADHTGELRCFPNAKIYARIWFPLPSAGTAMPISPRQKRSPKGSGLWRPRDTPAGTAS